MARKRIYIHKDTTIGLLFFGGGTLLAAYTIYTEGASLMSIIVLLTSGAVTFFILHLLWRDRHTEHVDIKPAWQTPVEIQADRILFPEGYMYKYSSIYQTKEILPVQIDEVHLQTIPVSVVIHHREVIFLPQQSPEALKQFALRHQLKISQRFDLWEAINEPFLDTEFDRDHKSQTLEILERDGLSKEEVNRIRRKIRFAMSANMFAWEWAYLGQFDYLNWAFLTKKKYWWSMEVALRNYETESSK